MKKYLNVVKHNNMQVKQSCNKVVPASKVHVVVEVKEVKIEKFVNDFYKIHGDLMSQLAYE